MSWALLTGTQPYKNTKYAVSLVWWNHQLRR